MRIRKRSGPLGFSSSISTIALSQYSSDPPLISTTRKHEEEEEEKEKKRLHPSFGDEHQPLDQVHQTSKTSSSDLELTFIRVNNGWVCCGDGDNKVLLEKDEKKKMDEFMMNTNTANPTHKMELKGLKEEEDEKMMIRRSTATKINRKSNSLGGDQEEVIDSGSGVPPCSSNISSHDDPHQVLVHEMWSEGVKGFPMKKRRGSNCERKVLGDVEITRTTTDMIKQKKIMKTTNPNKNWVFHEKESQETDSTSSAKKNEGSRCSRINGRGWRCCQQALVGYSLCEHHSGKGRLRSMNSVRNCSSTTATTTITTITKPIKNLETQVSLEKCYEDEEEDDDEEKTSTSISMTRIENKKRKKMGMVKARSISSLLGQTQVHDDYVKV